MARHGSGEDGEHPLKSAGGATTNEGVLNWLCRYAPAGALLLDDEGRLRTSLLDVGCGPHGFACAFPGVPFVGLDVTFPRPVDPSMVALRVSPGRLPFADATFGPVLCLDVLEHVPPADRAPFVRELSRVAAERVVLACPSSEAAHVDDWVRRLFGGATPEWLVEHDALGLPTPDEIAECAHGCDGFRAVPLAMPNSLVSALTVVADFLTPFTAQAAQEAAERPAEWVRLFEAARFGSSWRKGWIIEREQAVAPLVGPDADGLEAATLAAVRCPDCGGAFERVELEQLRAQTVLVGEDDPLPARV